MDKRYKLFFGLLRVGLGIDPTFTATPDESTWRWIYRESHRQALIGVLFCGIERLPATQRPPKDLLLKWAAEAQVLKVLNHLMDSEAARLTNIFDSRGMRSTVLKGQGNARMYPTEGSRMPGDIDLYVEGGKKRVLALLQAEKWMDEDNNISYHHVHLKPNRKGVTVEVHFRPSSGVHAPLANRRLQQILNEEIRHSTLCEKGFRVPTQIFHLLMQLAHLQHHFVEGGIGMRQVVDFYFVLQHASFNDIEVMKKLTKRTDTRQMAAALMALLEQTMLLDRERMIAEPDKATGSLLLAIIAEDGNFGKYAAREHQNHWIRFIKNRQRAFQLLRLLPYEVAWSELYHWLHLFVTLPERIRKGSVSLRTSTTTPITQ
ncbi:MAG: nucleotidyltransferase family protein [Phocaeicola plebeius]|nr:nucleotidyltransferase family protein [Phocaeicola plebeius]